MSTSLFTDNLTRVYLIVLIILLSLYIQPAESIPYNSQTPYRIISSLRSFNTTTMYSDIMSDNYTIYTSLPLNYSLTDDMYPVVYLLDADWHYDGSDSRWDEGGVLGIIEELESLGAMQEVILVGIGYPDQIERLRDFILLPQYFSMFLNEELIPAISSDYRVDNDSITLIGHSNGGLFTTNEMLRYPDTSFNKFIAISGDLDRGGYITYDNEELLHSRLNKSDLDVDCFMAVGGLEGPRFKEPNLEFAEILYGRNYTKFNHNFTYYPEHNHAGIVRPGFNEGLKWVFKTEPHAYYTINTTELEVNRPLRYQFTGSEGNGSVTFHWDFGDTTNSDLRGGIHYYRSPGEYIINLTITGDHGISSYVNLSDNHLYTVQVVASVPTDQQSVETRRPGVIRLDYFILPTLTLFWIRKRHPKTSTSNQLLK